MAMASGCGPAFTRTIDGAQHHLFPRTRKNGGCFSFLQAPPGADSRWDGGDAHSVAILAARAATPGAAVGGGITLDVGCGLCAGTRHLPWRRPALAATGSRDY